MPAAGAMLRCPRCSHAFPFEAPAEPTPENTPTIITDPIPDFGSLDTQTTPARQRSRKKRKSDPNWLTPVMIVTGLLGLSAAIWTVVLLASGGEQPPVAVAMDNEPAPKQQKQQQQVAGDFIQQLKSTAPDPPAGGESGPLKETVLKRVKAATVLLRVTDALGRKSTGSGFFAVHRKIIVTNAHVVGMLTPGVEKPQSVTVVVNSGEPNERTLIGDVASVDRESDLAVVQFQDDGKGPLPEPLKVYSARKLRETQSIYVSGFPLGEQLGRNITIAKSSVSSLRKDEHGDLHRVQVEGGMHPGNSGGPLVDSNGSVVGVAVSGVSGTGLNFAIPGDSLYRALNGRIANISFGESKQVGKEFWVPVTIETVDPLDQLSNLSIEWWIGNPGKSRLPVTSPPPPKTGDTVRRRVELVYSSGVASATIQIPPVPEGKTIHVQPVYQAASGHKQWMASVAYDPGPLLVLQDADLTPALRSVNSRLNVRVDTGMILQPFKGKESALKSNRFVRWVDVIGVASPQDIRRRMTIEQFRWTSKLDGNPAPRYAKLKPSLEFVKKIALGMKLERLGNLRTRNILTPNAPKQHEPALRILGRQLLDEVDFLTVPLPGKNLPAGSSWTSTRALPIILPMSYSTGRIELTYLYRGQAMHLGHRVAVIRVLGKLPTLTSENLVLNGSATGQAYFDLKTRRILTTEITLKINLLSTAAASQSKIATETRFIASRLLTPAQ